jgi:molybdopterin-guanine dinucleotide biosynthesis protein B
MSDLNRDGIPILALVGYSGSGKTTLVVKIIEELTRRGYRIATIKHAHAFSVEREGTDTWRHRKAGALISIASTPGEVVIVRKVPPNMEPDEIARAFIEGVDLILVEGYKRSRIPKIEVHRQEVGEGFFCLGDESLVAVASDTEVAAGVPRFHLDDGQGITDLIEGRFLKARRPASGKGAPGDRTPSVP